MVVKVAGSRGCVIISWTIFVLEIPAKVLEPLVFMAFFPELIFFFFFLFLEITRVVQKHLSGSELLQCDDQGSRNTHAHTHARAINFMSPC